METLRGADRVLTVSPNYSKEIQTASGGFNLQVPSVKPVSRESEKPMQWLHVVKSWWKGYQIWHMIYKCDRIHVKKLLLKYNLQKKTCTPLDLGFNQTLHRTSFRPKRPPCVSRVSWTASTTAGILLWIQTWPGALGNFAEVKLVDLAVWHSVITSI